MLKKVVLTVFTASIGFYFTAAIHAQATTATQPTPTTQPAPLTNSQMDERINFIQSEFDKGESAAQWWSYGWIGLYSAFAVGSVAFATRTAGLGKKGEEEKNWTNAGKSVLGLSSMLIVPFHARSSAEELRQMPQGTTAQREAKLSRAEFMLERNHDQQVLGTGWLRHTIGVLVQVVSALIIYETSGSSSQAIESSLIGFVVGEINILTQPTSGIDSYKAYQAKYKTMAHYRRVKTQWFVRGYPRGLVTGVYF